MIPIGTNLERNKLPVMTLAIIGVNVLIFVLETLLPDDTLRWVFQDFGFGPATRNPFAPITSLFLHGDIYHIAFNMLFLWIFGGPVEERVGGKAFLVYYFGAGVVAGILSVIMEMIARPDSTIPGIGASGAISGIMALFLYRCFYAKLKLVISPILIPSQVSVPVIPLVLFWFFRDVIMGIFSMSVPTGVGHWAHVGGFIFGIAVGRLKRYGHEGLLEQLRGKILKKLEEGGGWKSAEKDLLKLLDIAPNDAEVHHDLARLYASSGQQKSAEQYYLVAVQRYFLMNPVHAAYAVLEYRDALSKPMGAQYQLKAADAFIAIGEFEEAYRVLLPISNYGNAKGPLAEKSLMLLIKLCQHLNKLDEADECVKIFMVNFSNSKYLNEIKATAQRKPGEVFLQATPAPHVPENFQAGKEAERLGVIQFFERTFADPVFWVLLLFMNIAAPLLVPGLYYSQMSPVYLFTASFVMTIVHRMGSLSDLFHHLSAPSEETVRQEVAIQRNYDEAVLAEKKERFPEAAALYEKLLSAEPKNYQARFNLARIYKNRLNNIVNARRHYKILTELLPREHPYHQDAQDTLKTLLPSRSS